MDFFLLLLEGILWLLDALFAGLDVYAWLKGKENRIERKEARKAGTDVPPRDEWNDRVVVLTTIVFFLTLVLLIWLGARSLTRR